MAGGSRVTSRNPMHKLCTLHVCDGGLIHRGIARLLGDRILSGGDAVPREDSDTYMNLKGPFQVHIGVLSGNRITSAQYPVTQQAST